jgi:integrase
LQKWPSDIFVCFGEQRKQQFNKEDVLDMGSIYKQTWKDRDGKTRESAIWWIKYYRDGKPIRESSESEKITVARDLLKDREGDIVKGVPVSPKVNRVRFNELAADMVVDYKVNGKRSLDVLEMRLKRHILPFFATRRAFSITTADINRFVLVRQEAGASNGEINRELTAVKRSFSLGIQSGKILVKPYIPMLRENNIRTGFFEPEQFGALLLGLPEHLKPVAQFAYITGWRIPSEVLRLQWSQIDFLAGEIRLNAGTTKNNEGRVFPFTLDLRSLLSRQYSETRKLEREKKSVIPWVFHREGRRIGSFRKAWSRACLDAGLPVVIQYKRDSAGNVARRKSGPKKGEAVIEHIAAQAIPHDFRRTAVRNLVRAGIPEAVAMKMTGHKTRSVFERYNIVSAGDLTDAARKLDAVSAMGMITGMNAPNAGTLPTETSANLLHSNNGPVAQLDRAAVS